MRTTLHLTLVALALVAAFACESRPRTGDAPEALTVPAAAEAPRQAAPIRIAAWNANSGIPQDRGTHDGQIAIVRETVVGFEADIVALSEVAPHWMDEIENRADEARPMGMVRGTTGCNQRIAVLWAEDRFDLVERNEMTGVLDPSRCRRAPVVVGLRDRVSGAEFDVVAVHLTRGPGSEGDGIRAGEAMRLRQLLRDRGSRPVIVIGDTNADCPLDTAPAGCAPAFAELVEGGFLRWVDFEQRADTLCTERYDEMVDLAFVGRGAEAWAPTVEVTDYGGLCAMMERGAHLPIRLTFDPAAGPH